MEMDDAYANGAYIADAESYPPRWQSEAAAFREGLGARIALDVPYGPTERQRFDLMSPQGPRKGTVVFVHGGYWKAFDKSSWSHLAAGPLARGWSVAMPSYDLCPDVRISDITGQIAAAVTAIATKSSGPLALTGHSAGGHLVARMLDVGVVSAAIGRRIDRVVPISALADLRPLLRTSMNKDLRLDATEALTESPVFMSKRWPAKVTVWVGGDERPALADQSRMLADAWDAKLVVAPRRHHFDVIDALADPDSDLVEAVVGP